MSRGVLHLKGLSKDLEFINYIYENDIICKTVLTVIINQEPRKVRFMKGNVKNLLPL